MIPENHSSNEIILYREYNSLNECLDSAKKYIQCNREGVELVYKQNNLYFKCEVYKTRNGSFVYKTYKMEQA